MSVGVLVTAFIAGTSLSAAAGNLVEGRSQVKARLGLPFVDSNRIGLSLLRVLAAGPYLLVGEASHARYEGKCSFTAWCASIAFSGLWCLANGIVCLEMIWQIAQHFV